MWRVSIRFGLSRKTSETRPCGEMAEWLKAHAWKACIGLSPIGGSNPPLSVFFRFELGSAKIQINGQGCIAPI